MIAERYTAPNLPTVRLSDPADRVLKWMEELYLPHLPVVEDRQLHGILAADAILNADDPEVQVRELQLIRADGHFIFTEQHLYDAIAIMAFTGHSIVPVLDAEGLYTGAIGREEVVQAIADMSGVKEPGGIIVLDVAPANYHLREIASIVESADARVLSLYTAPLTETGQLLITLKLNISELSAVQASFERYGYKVAFAFFDQKQLDDTRDRYDALMNYLSIG
jgi:acetoin utilization protein AcuB